MTGRLSAFSALTFDCYGTLIDWETGIWDALQPLLMKNRCSEIDRDEGLAAFALQESKQQAETPALRYTELLGRVHRAIAVQFDLASSDELDAAFGASIPHWPAFPDSADALRSLKTRFRLVILSNVDRAGFAASNQKLGVEFDAIYTAEDIGSYKPARANFEYLLAGVKRDLDLEPGDVLHTAQSLFHDHAPAKAFGLANAWIDRQRLSETGSWGAVRDLDERPAVDFVFFSLAEMAAAAAAESP